MKKSSSLPADFVITDNSMITIETFCQILNIHESTYHRNRRKGLLPDGIRVGSKAKRIPGHVARKCFEGTWLA